MPTRATAARAGSGQDYGLTSRMAGMGMNFAATPAGGADLEATLIEASLVGMEEGDLRVLSVLTTWFGVHHTYVNADRLVRLVRELSSARARAYWAALGAWQAKDRRFARLVQVGEAQPIDLLPVGSPFQLARRGEDPRFQGTPLRVPAGTLRDRLADVLSPQELAAIHPTYRNRVLMGPTWRADAWTVLEQEPELSVSEVARRVGCSFATAWQVARDARLWRASSGNAALP